MYKDMSRDNYLAMEIMMNSYKVPTKPIEPFMNGVGNYQQPKLYEEKESPVEEIMKFDMNQKYDSDKSKLDNIVVNFAQIHKNRESNPNMIYVDFPELYKKFG